MRVFSLFVVAAMVLALPVSAGHHKSGEAREGGKQGRFAKYDTNGDNKISEAEFMAMAAKRFKKMDANGDGSLTKDEMKPRREKRKDD